MKNLLQPQFEKFGMKINTDSERLDTISYQEMIIRKSCMYGNDRCLQEVKKLFEQYQNSSDKENP